mmetsp:Transcript_149994/g.261975  ORF Transcript_149994/g.261975 Transcript_149994/m.261975 type:complete len:80 (+) Transcript_149994:1066-1305(+)
MEEGNAHMKMSTQGQLWGCAQVGILLQMDGLGKMQWPCSCSTHISIIIIMSLSVLSAKRYCNAEHIRCMEPHQALVLLF